VSQTSVVHLSIRAHGLRKGDGMVHFTFRRYQAYLLRIETTVDKLVCYTSFPKKDGSRSRADNVKERSVTSNVTRIMQVDCSADLKCVVGQ